MRSRRETRRSGRGNWAYKLGIKRRNLMIHRACLCTNRHRITFCNYCYNSDDFLCPNGYGFRKSILEISKGICKKCGISDVIKEQNPKEQEDTEMHPIQEVRNLHQEWTKLQEDAENLTNIFNDADCLRNEFLLAKARIDRKVADATTAFETARKPAINATAVANTARAKFEQAAAKYAITNLQLSAADGMQNSCAPPEKENI